MKLFAINNPDYLAYCGYDPTAQENQCALEKAFLGINALLENNEINAFYKCVFSLYKQVTQTLVDRDCQPAAVKTPAK